MSARRKEQRVFRIASLPLPLLPVSNHCSLSFLAASLHGSHFCFRANHLQFTHGNCNHCTSWRNCNHSLTCLSFQISFIQLPPQGPRLLSIHTPNTDKPPLFCIALELETNPSRYSIPFRYTPQLPILGIHFHSLIKNELRVAASFPGRS